jgi:hypothetical protein
MLENSNPIQLVHDLGRFVDLTVLQAQYPSGRPGDFARLTSTETIWNWTGAAWVDSLVDTSNIELQTIKIRNLAYGQSFMDIVKNRVTTDNGEIIPNEAAAEIANYKELVLLHKANTLVFPGYRKAGKVYASKPLTGTGDLTIDRNCPAFEINNDCMLKQVGANVPRFNHAVIGGSPKLIIEPELVQLQTNPVSFSNWDSSGADTDDNGGAGYESPSTDYNSHAFKLIEDSSTGQHYIEEVLIGQSTDSIHSFKIFVKKGERTKLGFRESGYSGDYVSFDVDTRSVISSVNATVTFKDFALDFVECTIQFPSGLSGTIRTRIYLLDSNYTAGDISNYSYTGTPGEGLYLFLANLVKTSVSFLPIYDGIEGSSTTRLKDHFNNQSLDITGGEFSILLNIEIPSYQVGIISFYNAAGTQIFYLAVNSLGSLFLSSIIGGGTVTYDNIILAKNKPYKYLIRVSNGIVSHFLSGAKHITTGITTATDLNKIVPLNGYGYSSNFAVESIGFFKGILSDANCINLIS